MDELAARSAVLERSQRGAFQRLGLVRFNPFEDTGGNQSFALALLDRTATGSSSAACTPGPPRACTGRRSPAAASEAALSDEEAEALRLALASGTGRREGG